MVEDDQDSLEIVAKTLEKGGHHVITAANGISWVAAPAGFVSGPRMLKIVRMPSSLRTGATFFIITHNIPSVMRTAEFMGVLFRSGLVQFGSMQTHRPASPR